MLDQVKDILNKIPYSIAALGTGLWVYINYYKFENNDDSPKQVKLSELKRAQTSRDSIQKKVDEAERFYAQLEEKREELRLLARKLGEMKATLSERIDESEVMNTITLEAKRAGLRVKRVAPVNEIPQEFYIEKPFRFLFRGVYAQLLMFLHRLNETNRILRVESFNLKPRVRRSRSAEKIIVLDGNLTISAYRYNASKADEIASAAAKTKKPASDNNRRGGGSR